MIKKFFKWLWELIKSFNTPKGLISLTISFMIFCGWALVFIGLGIGFKNAKLIAIGSAVIVFWSAPLTPMWPIIIAVAVFIRKVILKEREKEQMYLIFKMVGNDWVACRDKNGKEIRVKSKKEAFKRLRLLTLVDKKENANCYRVFKMYNPYNI